MSTLLQKRHRMTRCGLEVPSGLTYRGWEPGGEYTKPLVLKNVQLKTQRVRCRVSGSPFFASVYPQPIVLSAGTSYTLPITFRPIATNPYEEQIEIETGEGIFKVPVKALLPKPNLSLPDCLKFGKCAVQDSINVNFEVCNISTVATTFQWDLPKGFDIAPPMGSLAPKQSLKLKATFSPDSSLVYSAVAVCKYGHENESAKTVRLEGVGKYPHVMVRLSKGKVVPKPVNKTRSKKMLERGGEGGRDVVDWIGEGFGHELEVNFGGVAVGTVAEKWIEVTNVSPVITTFTVTPLKPSLSPSSLLPDFLFGCSEYSGSLQPLSSRRLKLQFSPSLPASHPSVGYFVVKACSGLGECSVKCVGRAAAPQVSIEKNIVNFGNTECGQTATGSIHLRNKSDIEAIFQLQMDAQSVFCVETLEGVLAPNSHRTIKVHFRPHKPIPHCRRVACLVQHQEPIFVYFMGSGYTETVKPAVLESKHIATFKAHASSGLSSLPPELMKHYATEGKIALNDDGVFVPVDLPGLPSLNELPTLVPREWDSPYAHFLHSEHELSGKPHISTDVDLLKFDYCKPNQASETKVVNVTNHTLGTLVCVWITASADNFHVVPDNREIAAGKTASFSVNFKPSVTGQVCAKELECFVFYKALGDYRHVDSSTLSPPWCLTVRASGHTFAPESETFHPKVTFDPSSVVFPATTAGRPVHRTVVWRNHGDTPVLFDIAKDSKGVFLVKPSHGVIRDKYQVFVLEMLSREVRVNKLLLQCHLSARGSSPPEQWLLSGSAELQKVSLENEGQLFFGPTCIGNTSTTLFSVTNTSRLPACFAWRVMGAGHGILQVVPTTGTLLPNETQNHEWKFSPRECQDYSLKAVVEVSLDPVLQGGSSAKKTKSILSIHGKGCTGMMKCQPSDLDCGTVVTGVSQSHKLTLCNPNPCHLLYRLFVEVDGNPEEGLDKRSVVELSPVEGVLHAHCTEQVAVTVRPRTRKQYHCSIKYHLLTSREDKQSLGVSVLGNTLCSIKMKGAYPSLHIADIQGDGVASGMSKTRIWHMLSIERLNQYLLEEPYDSELRYAIATRHSMQRKVPVHTKAIVDFDFGAGQVNAGSSSVHLLIKNSGDIETEWAFQFPTDMHLEPEYWADSGHLDDVERHELNVIDNDLFAVQPKNGLLQPGGSTLITCSFKHTHVGTSKLPVLLKINRGREILLNWTGVTVDHQQPYVHFTSTHHKFTPVAIGTHAYPRQVFELHNAGDTPLGYRIDTGPLEALKAQNYLMPVFECLQPEGTVPLCGTASIQFVFSPLEAKTYTVDTPIHFSTGDTCLFTFSGQGYDPQHLLKEQDSSSDSQMIPARCGVTISGQLAHLSQEIIRLGEIPQFAVFRRLVFIANTSAHTLSFQWDLTSDRVQEVLSIQPAQGYIRPHQSAACKITFTSHASPACHDIDITCKIADESEMLEYKLQLMEWTKQQEERKHTFTITATDSPSEKKRPQTIPIVQSPRERGKQGRRSSSELRAKYRALPPIGNSSQEEKEEGETYEEWKKKDLSTKSKTRPRQQKASSNEPPSQPSPHLLHLGITARTHAIPDYAKQFDDFDTFFIDQQALCSSSCRNSGSEVLAVRREEKDMLLSVLSQINRELLEDTNFLSVLDKIAEEPVPYFTQFGHTDQATASHTVSRPALIAVEHPQPSPQTQTAPSLPPPHLDSLQLPPTVQPPSLAVTGVGGEVEEEEDILCRREQELDGRKMEEDIKHLPEFGSLVESIAENCVVNLLKEAISGELNITAPLYHIAESLTAA